MRPEERLIEDFYSEELVLRLLGRAGECGHDNMRIQMGEMLHGMMSWMRDTDATLDPLYVQVEDVVRKYGDTEETTHQWDWNPYAEKVYQTLGIMEKGEV